MNFPLKPEAASEHAVGYDYLFNTIVGLTIFFTVVVGLLVLVLAIRYRRGSKVDRKNPITHHLGLELTWLFVPLVLGLGIFAWSAVRFVDFRTEPEDAKEVLVIGKQWMWHVQHMNGIRENNELHVPVGKPVKLTMISQDVIHAMYLPEFRVQYHVVPGRYTELYFTPNKTGKFKLLCGMHCGTQHSEMVGYVYVLSEPDYIDWVENEGDRFRDIPQTMVAAGRQLYEKYNCSSCHGQQNSVRGPSLYGLLGRTRNFRDGSSTVADIEYIRDSIVNPYDRVVSGYEETMPAYGGQLTEEQIFSMVKYIESLSLGNQEGDKAPYEQPVPQFERGPSAPETATDIANDRASAGASQAQEVETYE